MKKQTVKSNIWDLKEGDIISFTNSVGYKMLLNVTRVENKSWYEGGENRTNARNSYGTLGRFSRYSDFKIIRK